MKLAHEVRLHVYRSFVEEGRAPKVTEIALSLQRSLEEIEAALEELHEGHVLVLRPGSREVWMAMPFSAIPTAFEVESAGTRWWANCAWDSLGIPALLHADATVTAHCADCDEPMTLSVLDGELVESEGRVHFAVPTARWWDDVGFT